MSSTATLEPAPARPRLAPAPPSPAHAPAALSPAPVAAVPPPPPAAGNPPAKAKHRRPFLLALGAMVLLGAGVYGGKAFVHARHHESTDDAFVEGHVVQVSPKVAAHVIAVRFDDNQEVKQGQTLVELDPRDYAVAVEVAEANLLAARGRLAQAEAQGVVARAGADQARAEIASAEATSENAAADLRRNQDLNRQRVIDRREFDASNAQAKGAAASLEAVRQRAAGARAQIALAEAQVQAARAEATQGEAGVRQARLNLGYCTITAPADGRVARKNVEPGNYAQPGQALLAVVQHDVWVVANFKETQLTDMRPGQPVELRVDAFPGRPLRGHVESLQLGTGARFSLLPPENATGNYVKVVQRNPTKIIFDEPADTLQKLAPGMSVEPEVRVR